MLSHTFPEGRENQPEVVYFSGFEIIIRRLYFADCSSHTRLRQLADFPSLFLKGRYIQPKGKSIGEKISHRTGRLGKAEKAEKIGKAGKNGGDIGYCGKLSIRKNCHFVSCF